MKKILYSVLSVLLLFLGSACEKDETSYRATANITVINTASGNDAIKVNPGAGGGFAYSKATAIATSGVFGAFTGNNTITVVKATDTTIKLFQRTIDLRPISTLYIAGTSTAIDTIFRTENNFPYINSSDINAEKAMYIRFVNLSPNSNTVNIRIAGNATNEVTNLTYKSIAEFKKYVATTSTSDYTFEIMDATNTSVLTSITINTNSTRYKTASIIFKGLLDTPESASTDPVSAFQVNYN